MRLTRQRLKQIIMEEINLVEATPDMADLDLQVVDDQGNAPANQGGMDEITEGEGMEMLQHAAQVLIDAGILGAESPEELMMALKGLGKTAIAPLAAIAMGGAAMAGKDAITKIMSKDTDESPERVQEEENDNALEELITQAIQEELGRL
jgi:hypothetical protein